MTDHNREERETLIEKARERLTDAIKGHVIDSRVMYEDEIDDLILTVQEAEQAHTPASDEREALAALIDPDTSRAGWNANAHDVRDQINGLHIKRGVYRIVDRILAAGFRRTVQGGPSWGRIYEVARKAQDRGIDAAWIADRLTPDPRTVQGQLEQGE